MRAFAAMLRWLSPGILGIAVLLSAAAPAHADTGTYQINSYITTLEPQSNGSVRITYQQQWQVLSGSIPWITVGLANSSFTVQDWGGAAQRVYPDNGGGFTGIRADLDRSYLSGETFTITFTVFQNSLLERDTKREVWRIDFIPGWYDRAAIGLLQINLVSPVATDSFSLNPPSTSIAGNVITWEKANLPPGARFEIRAESTDGSFLAASTPAARQGPNPWPIVIGVAIAAAVTALIVVAIVRARQVRDAALKARIAATERELAENRDKRAQAEKGFREYIVKEDIQPDEQGRYYDRSYGGYITPAIWWAVLMSQQHRTNGTPPQRGGGGISCACACVSCACACACACAGGGAAGCSPKTLKQAAIESEKKGGR